MEVVVLLDVLGESPAIRSAIPRIAQATCDESVSRIPPPPQNTSSRTATIAAATKQPMRLRLGTGNPSAAEAVAGGGGGGGGMVSEGDGEYPPASGMWESWSLMVPSLETA